MSRIFAFLKTLLPAGLSVENESMALLFLFFGLIGVVLVFGLIAGTRALRNHPKILASLLVATAWGALGYPFSQILSAGWHWWSLQQKVEMVGIGILVGLSITGITTFAVFEIRRRLNMNSALQGLGLKF